MSDATDGPGPHAHRNIKIHPDGWRAGGYLVELEGSFYHVTSRELSVVEKMIDAGALADLAARLRQSGIASSRRSDDVTSVIRLPAEITRRICGALAWLAHPLTAAAVALAVALAALSIASRGDLVRDLYTRGLGAQIVVFSFLFAFTTAPFHEIAHGATLRRLGEVPGTSGIGFHGRWAMAAFIDVDRVWALRDRTSRLAVWASGPIVDAGFAAAGVLLWVHSSSAGKEIGLSLALACSLKLVANLNPILGGDGEQILSELCGSPRVATRLRVALASGFRRARLLGQPIVPRELRAPAIAIVLYQPLFASMVVAVLAGVILAIRHGEFWGS